MWNPYLLRVDHMLLRHFRASHKLPCREVPLDMRSRSVRHDDLASRGALTYALIWRRLCETAMAVCQTIQRHLSYGEDRLAFGTTAIPGAQIRNPHNNLCWRKLAFCQRGSKYIFLCLHFRPASSVRLDGRNLIPGRGEKFFSSPHPASTVQPLSDGYRLGWGDASDSPPSSDQIKNSGLHLHPRGVNETGGQILPPYLSSALLRLQQKQAQFSIHACLSMYRGA
jgi:hypothetical protein